MVRDLLEKSSIYFEINMVDMDEKIFVIIPAKCMAYAVSEVQFCTQQTAMKWRRPP